MHPTFYRIERLWFVGLEFLRIGYPVLPPALSVDATKLHTLRPVSVTALAASSHVPSIYGIPTVLLHPGGELLSDHQAKRKNSRAIQNVQHLGNLWARVRVLIPARLHQRPQFSCEAWMCRPWWAHSLRYMQYSHGRCLITEWNGASEYLYRCETVSRSYMHSR